MNKAKGYCCSANDTSSEFCIESETISCSSDLAFFDNRYGYCLYAKEAQCGTFTYDLDNTDPTNVSSTDLVMRSKNGSVC
mmetsp:Transcript_26502/g.19855  ORF Transcript_26502/g.19855 Transcript_26502/m.19855 type:complete len:80 (+) Transcript_26502:135-374(+)